MTLINKNTKSKIMGVMHSLVIPFGMGFYFGNILFLLGWWCFAVAMYETEECANKSGRNIFYVLATLSAFIVVLALTTKGA